MTNIINVSPSSDNMTPIFNKIIKDIKYSGTNTLIKLEKGDYYFKRSGSEKRKIFSSGGMSCENYVLFPIENINDLTIEGNDSNFIYCDRVQPFLISNSNNITIKNISTDYSFYRYAFAKIISVADNGFEIDLNEEEFKYFVKDGFLNFVCGDDVLSTQSRQISVRRFEPIKSFVKFFRVGNCEAPFNGAADNIYVNAAKTENGVFFEYRAENNCKIDYSVGDKIILGYDNSREAQAFYCEFSKNIVLENVCIYRSGGMGFVADVCENIILDNFKIIKKEGRNEYFTTTADGIYSTNCSGDFILKNSYIADTYDDAINIHGYYSKVDEVLSKNKIKISYLHFAHWGLLPYYKGDKLHFSNSETLNEEFVIEVEDVSFDENRNNIYITFKNEADFKSGMLIENPDRTPKVLIENNNITRAPHIRLAARNIMVKNNDLSLEDCDIYIHDLVKFWGESGAVKKVEIIGNKFGNAKEGNIIVGSDRSINSNRLHEKIIIKDNIFNKIRDEAIEISSVMEVFESNNIFNKR